MRYITLLISIEFLINQNLIILEQVTEFFGNLFQTESWPARWNCGTWSEFHGWLYICSDLAIWAAYFVIPFFIIKFIKAKPNIPLPKVFWLFGAFILFCGLTHLIDAIIFWWPGYRLSALLRFITAIVSWLTIVAIYKYIPTALRLRTTKDFEAELRERKKSESKFMGLLESAPDAMVITNSEGKILMVNAQTERIFGFMRDEIMGKEVEILIPERFHHKHTFHRQGYVENPKVRGMGIGMDLSGKRKDGSEFPVEISLSPMKIMEEEEVLVIAAIRDITKQKKEESKFIGLLESAPDAMIITSSDGEILMVNAQTERIFGFTRDEIIGKKVEHLVPQRFHHMHTSHRDGYIENPKVRGMGIGMNLFAKRKDGSEFPVEISLSPMKIMEEDKDEIIIISAIRDITKQKEAEAEIKKLNENLERLVIERTSELELALEKEKTARSEMHQDQLRLAFLTKASNVLASSLDYLITLTNLANLVTPAIADCCAIDEVEKDGTIKRIVVSHVDPEKIKLVYELSQKYPPVNNASKGIYEVIRSHQSELYHIISAELIESVAHDKEHLRLINALGFKSVIMVPLHNRDKIYGVMTLVLSDSGRMFDEKDLEFANELGRRTTLAIENAKLYNEMQENNTELEQRVAKRTMELETINKELEAFSYSVSHDLRAPLRSIDGFSNKILKDYGELFDDVGKDYFMRVKNASQHMGHLIDDLLKLARISRVEMNMRKVSLSDLAQSIAGELKELNMERKASFLIEDDMEAMGDRNLIQIALQNLLENAWKYSKNKPLTLIEFGSIKKDEQITYFIRDNGVGFDMKYSDKLFGAFQRLHSQNEFEGTGIGLATVQRIIRRHHGTIWAESEVNNGTTFFFTL